MVTQSESMPVPGTKTTWMQKGEREIVFERLYDAPRKAVFDAFCDPKRIPEWWGPPGTTTTVANMEVKIGGAWRFVHKDANGQTHIFSGIYRDVTPPSKLVSTLLYGDAADLTIIETYEFLEEGRKTLLRVTSMYPFAGALGGMLAVGMDQSGGWVEGSRHQWRLERLAKLVG